MIKFGKIVLLIFVGILLQTSVLSAEFQRVLAGNQPDLLLVLTVVIATTEGAYCGAIVGFISGLLLDCFSNQLGINALNLLLFGYATGLCARKIFLDNTVSQSLIVFVVTLISKMFMLSFIAMYSYGGIVISWSSQLTRYWFFLPSAILNVGLSLLIFRFLKKGDIIQKYGMQRLMK